MTIATAVSSQTTPAAVEFALLQSWLASGSALQLSLHEIERQQQARGREVQRLFLQAHLQQRVGGAERRGQSGNAGKGHGATG